MKHTLLTALRKIHEDPYPSTGICSQVDWFTEDYYHKDRFRIQELLYGLFESWPKYSGQRDFPIPHPDPHKSPILAYNTNPDNHWDRTTPYGALRWELLEFCIAQLENPNGN